jgi:EPS-associated MarR family transcriptional regulator
MNHQELELAILEAVVKAPNQKTLAHDIGYSVGKVNFVLKGLVEKGCVKADRFLNSKKKYQYKYLLTKEGITQKIQLTESFIKRKKQEYDKLQKNLEKYKEMYK